MSPEEETSAGERRRPARLQTWTWGPGGWSNGRNLDVVIDQGKEGYLLAAWGLGYRWPRETI